MGISEVKKRQCFVVISVVTKGKFLWLLGWLKKAVFNGF